MRIRSNDESDLDEPGMTFAVHAGYELPESGRILVPLGDMSHVSEKGAGILIEFPRTPFAAGQDANRT